MTLQCTNCGQLKDEQDFVPSLLKRGARLCRPCKADYNRSWYQRNKERQRANVLRNNARYRARARALIDALKSRPCADCGRVLPPVAMDFDHVRGEKVEIVSRIPRRQFSLERLEAEIAKCEVVCAVCHRLRTARRLKAGPAAGASDSAATTRDEGEPPR